MNKKVKKSFSLLLTVLMLVSCVSIGIIPAYAADVDTSELNAVLDKANAINADDYTDVSSLTAAVESAKNTELDTQQIVDDITAKIQIELLKLEKVDKTEKKSVLTYSNWLQQGKTQVTGKVTLKNVNGGKDVSGTVYIWWDSTGAGAYRHPDSNATAYVYADKYKTSSLKDLNITAEMYYTGPWVRYETGTLSFNGKSLGSIFHDGWKNGTSYSSKSIGPYTLDADLAEKGNSVTYELKDSGCIWDQPDNAEHYVYQIIELTQATYDTTDLRTAIAQPVDSKSEYSPLSYSVYLSALENAMNVLNTQVTTVSLDGDGAAYDNIAAAQQAIDNATDRLNNAYKALDKDFVIEYYSDSELFGSQTVLYSDIYTDTLTSAIPTKAGYVFTAWTSENGNKYTSDDLTSALAPSNGGTVKLYAEFETNEYTVTFANYDGEVLETKTVEYGHTAVYTGETPAKPADGDNVYTFTGWDKDITSPITSDTVFTAVFNTHTHEFTELIEVTKEANCTQTGKAVYACECGETKEIETPINPDNHDLIHHEAKAPTCSENGHIAYDVCSRCDYNTYEEIPLDPTAHKYGEWITDGEADCLTGGTKHRVCEYNESHIETVEIPATGAHTYDDGKVTTEPTCSSEGVKTYTCSVCGTIKTEIIPINPDAHSYGEFVIVKNETCTTDGEMRKVCKYNDNHIISEIIPASGHNIVHHDGKAATCTSEGYKPYDTCSKCDYSTYEKTAKLSHNFVLSKHKDSTCSEKGYDLYKCTLCSDTKKTELALKSHTWDDGVITKEPTSESNGEKTYTCKVCGLTKTAKLYLCSHCNEIFEGDDSYNEHIADVGSVCPYCGQKHDKYLEHMTFVKLKCFLTRLFNLIFGFFKGLK